MRRRDILALAGGGLVALIGAGAAVGALIPVIPKRPLPDLADAVGWITHRDGGFTLALPRAEMGQNIATALKQVAVAELGVAWEAVEVELHDTALPRLRATVGSESVMQFAEPLAQACAALRDALAAGRQQGQVEVSPRPFGELRAFQSGGALGASPEIVQGREVVTGAPLYSADVRLPGMLYGRVLRAPAPVETASRPRQWDVAAALRIPGFVAVVEACGPPIGRAWGLGILAQRPGALEAITEALAIEWEIDDRSKVRDISQTIDIDARLEKGTLPHRVMDGAPEPGAWDVDLRLDVPLAAHAPIEPRAAVAAWDAGALRVWSGTQDAFYVRDVLADAFKVSATQVTVQSCRIGGAFGGKTICTVEAEAAALSKAGAAPVKVQWTRAQEFALGFHRPPSSHRVQARLVDGQITDWRHGQVSSHILFTAAVAPVWMQRGTDLLVGDGGVARGMKAPYALGRAQASYDAERLSVHTGPWRGLGAGPNGLAVESAMDEAAFAAGIDPLVFRLAHVSDVRLAGVLRRVAEIAEWGRSPAPSAAVETGYRTGRGLACGVYKETSYAAVVADVAVTPEGQVTVTKLWCAHDCGLVINPDQVRAQCEGNLVWSIGMVLSDTLPVEAGRVVAETFADAPIPRLRDTPPMVIDLVVGSNTLSGAGETAIVAGPGAIANAIRAATGQRPVKFPIDPAGFVLAP